MAGKPVVWTSRAEKELYEALNYWNERTLSTKFSKKLVALVKRNEALIASFEKIGRPTSKPNVRIRVISFYLMAYEIGDKQIAILTFFDARQDPAKFSNLLDDL